MKKRKQVIALTFLIFPAALPQVGQRVRPKKIYEAMQLHLDGLLEEKIKLPKMQAVSEVFVFS